MFVNTSRQRGWLYAAIVVNLLLWLAVLASAFGDRVGNTKALAIAGVAFAAVGQHLAYYNLSKVHRDQPPLA